MINNVTKYPRVCKVKQRKTQTLPDASGKVETKAKKEYFEGVIFNHRYALIEHKNCINLAFRSEILYISTTPPNHTITV